MALTNFTYIVEQAAKKKNVFMGTYLKSLIKDAENKLNKKEIGVGEAIEIIKKDKEMRIKLDKKDWWWIQDSVH